MTQTTISPNGHKRAVLYARVSTDEQADNYSQPTQLEGCKKYVADNGMVIMAELADDYSGATPIEQRPEGRKAYNMLKTGEADCLVAYCMDRIVRPEKEGDEWLVPVWIKGLADLGKEIHTVDMGQIKTDFVSLLLATFSAKTAGDERRKIIERTTRGRNGKAKSGRVVGSGYAPFGYKFATERVLNPKTRLYREVVTGLEELPAEAETVKLIYSWYTAGDDGNGPLSACSIARKLSESGIPAPGAEKKRSRGNAIWNFNSVLRILDSETYAGVWRYGRQIGGGKNGRKSRPVAEQIAVTIPAIVDRKTWATAQARLAHNREESLHNRAKHDYILRGRIRCACGSAMTGATHSDEGISFYYYRCAKCKNQYKELEPVTCRAKMVRAKIIEAGVWDIIYNAMTGDPDQFERDLREAQALQEQQSKPKVDELQTVLDYLAEAEKEADEIAQALRKAKGAVATSLERQQDECNKKYDALTKRRDELQAELSQRTLTDEAIDETLQFRADVAAGLREPTNDDVRFYYRQLNVRVTVNGDVVTVLYDVPTGTVTTFSLNDYRTQEGTLIVSLKPITITKTFLLSAVRLNRATPYSYTRKNALLDLGKMAEVLQ